MRIRSPLPLSPHSLPQHMNPIFHEGNPFESPYCCICENYYHGIRATWKRNVLFSLQHHPTPATNNFQPERGFHFHCFGLKGGHHRVIAFFGDLPSPPCIYLVLQYAWRTVCMLRAELRHVGTAVQQVHATSTVARSLRVATTCASLVDDVDHSDLGYFTAESCRLGSCLGHSPVTYIVHRQPRVGAPLVDDVYNPVQ